MEFYCVCVCVCVCVSEEDNLQEITITILSDFLDKHTYLGDW